MAGAISAEVRDASKRVWKRAGTIGERLFPIIAIGATLGSPIESINDGFRSPSGKLPVANARVNNLQNVSEGPESHFGSGSFFFGFSFDDSGNVVLIVCLDAFPIRFKSIRIILL